MWFPQICVCLNCTHDCASQPRLVRQSSHWYHGSLFICLSYNHFIRSYSAYKATSLPVDLPAPWRQPWLCNLDGSSPCNNEIPNARLGEEWCWWDSIIKVMFKPSMRLVKHDQRLVNSTFSQLHLKPRQVNCVIIFNHCGAFSMPEIVILQID